MSDLIFRKARATDLPDIVALLADDAIGRSRENAALPLDGRYGAAFEAVERDVNQLLMVAERVGVVVGSLQISFIPGLSRRGMLRGQIESVRIASGERGRGLGHQLLEWAICECRRRGCGMVQLTADKSRTDALRFYESLGFRALHEGLKLSLD